MALLLNTWYQTMGCQCNPTTSQRSPNHVCPIITQLAMMHCRSRKDLLVPYLTDDERASTCLATDLPAEVLTMFLETMHNRAYHRF